MAADRIRRWVVVTLAFALTTTACWDGQADVPSDYTTLTGTGFEVSFPSEWQITVHEVDEAAAQAGDAGAAAQPSVRAKFDGPITGPLDANATAGTRLGALSTGPREFLVEEPVDVAGADEAWIVESTWILQTDDGQIAMRQFDIYSVLEGDLAYLGVVASEAEFGDEQRRIVDLYRRLPADVSS